MPLERKDVEQKYKWDLSVIYKDEKAFYDEYARAEKLVAAFAKHEKTMCNSARDFYAALTDMTAIEAVIEMLWQYASLNSTTSTNAVTKRDMLSLRLSQCGISRSSTQ